MTSSSSRSAASPDCRERAFDHRDQAFAEQLNRRQVDGELTFDGQVPRPRTPSQHPFAERHDDAGFLGERDEGHRRDHAALRVMPAHQRLEAAGTLIVRIDHRLIMDREFAPLQRLPHLELSV